MLLGQRINNQHEPVKVGDFVYVYCYLNLRNAYKTMINDSGFGVVVDTSAYNDCSYAYLLASTTVGVLINGKINWYSPDEIHRVSARNAG